LPVIHTMLLAYRYPVHHHDDLTAGLAHHSPGLSHRGRENGLGPLL